MIEVSIKTIEKKDVEPIVEMQKRSFPFLAEVGVVWKPEQLLRHIEIFKKGQFCAVYRGNVVGSASSLIVMMNEPYKAHTWREITGGSFFENHNSHGDTLYGADVSVHPKYRRLGIATKLYDARKSLCRNLNLRRIIAGGRLYNYCEKAAEMSAEDYARKVVRHELSDPVLSFQLRNGFKFIKIMPNYMKDPRSLNNATLIEWINREYSKK